MKQFVPLALIGALLLTSCGEYRRRAAAEESARRVCAGEAILAMLEQQKSYYDQLRQLYSDEAKRYGTLARLRITPPEQAYSHLQEAKRMADSALVTAREAMYLFEFSTHGGHVVKAQAAEDSARYHSQTPEDSVRYAKSAAWYREWAEEMSYRFAEKADVEKQLEAMVEAVLADPEHVCNRPAQGKES